MKERILIVGDASDVLSALRYLFKTEGYETCCAHNLGEVRAALEKSDADLLLILCLYHVYKKKG